MAIRAGTLIRNGRIVGSGWVETPIETTRNEVLVRLGEAGSDFDVDRMEPEFLHKIIIGADRATLENKTANPIERERTFTDSTESVTSTSEHIGVKASLQFRQLISYGGDASPVSGETEITVAVETEYSRDSSRSESVGSQDTGTWRGEIPPRTIRHLDRKLEMGRYKQLVKITGELDWGTYIYSHKDFNVHWEGCDEMKQCLSGVGRKRSDRQTWAEMYNRLPIDKYQTSVDANWLIRYLTSPITAMIEVEDEFDRATDVRYTWGDEPIGG